MEKVLISVRAGDSNYRQWTYNPLTRVVKEYDVRVDEDDRYLRTWYEVDKFVTILRELIDALSTELVKEVEPSEAVEG